MSENKKNENVKNNDEQMVKAKKGHKHRKPKFDPVGGFNKFVDDNKKWIIIGGCFLAGLALGGAGTMIANKGRSEREADEVEQAAKSDL